MPVKLCPYCKNPVTSRATLCHTCGNALVGNAIKRGIGKFILDSLLVLIAIAIVVGGIWYLGFRTVGA